MNTTKLSLNLFQNCLEDEGFEVKFFYDRVKLYVDSANKKSKIEQIDSTGPWHVITPRTLLHYDTMSLLLDAHQPDLSYLEKLDHALTGDYLINYIEFAMDIVSSSKEQILKLRKLIDQLLVFERKRSAYQFYFNHEENTHYFGSRYKHKNNLVVYSNKESKLDKTKRCVHIELRFSGSKIIKDLGIYTIQDLINFSHENIWNQNLDLRDLNYNALGRMLSEAKTGLADSSYWRLGQKMANQYRSVQELLMMEPHCAEALVPIKDRRMFESRLISALK